jgi:hypothetical protein
LTPLVPDDVLVYTLYSRACDPTMGFLVRDQRLSHEQIVERWCMQPWWIFV